MPQATGDVPNRLGDLSRDLLSVAGGEQQARQDFVDDLKVFARSPATAAAVEPFSQHFAEAVSGTKLTEQGAQQLAHSAWTVVAATELSSRQIDALEAEVKTNLVSAGVAADRATSVAADAKAVQQAISTRPRRWYELF